jgi:ferredoxin
LNNIAAFNLEKIDIYFLYPIEIKGLTFLKIIFPSLIFLLILILTLINGRLFCNTVCPVGTFLSLISKVSFLKIRIKEEECISCRLCEQVCKSGCIDRVNKSLDFSRCVSCYNCLSVCASGGIGFKTTLPYRLSSYEKEEKVLVDKKRREFISKTLVWFLGFTGIAAAQLKIIPKKESTIPVYKKYPVSPPGSKSIDEFNERCTACNLCVAACPTQVLQPSYLEYGLLGILQPRMDYQTSFCNYDCIICTEVCPTDAIQLTNPLQKKLTQIGKSKFIKENCIVYTEETACGACSEHCPTKAVNMIPYKKITIPEVKDEYCIGCGACEFACPTKPYKAIYVEGNPVHQTAKKPEEKKLEEKINYQEDFPF